MRIYILCLSIIISCFTASAQFIGAGEGTSDSPYLITNSAELNQLRALSTGPDTYFELANDIDMTSWIEDNNPKLGFSPIPDFSGHLDGKNHTIKFFINRPNVDYVGLFAYANNATILDLRIEGDVVGNNYVGGLVGYSDANNNYGTTISGCYFSGSISGQSNVGGIVGCLNSSIGKKALLSYCSFSGNIKGTSYVAGITGNTSGDISYCVSNSIIEATGDYVGGIVGSVTAYRYYLSLSSGAGYYREEDGSVKYCMSDGSISGNNYVGGISGSCYGSTVSNNLNKASVYGIGEIGGIIGRIYGASLYSSHASSNVCVCDEIIASSDNAYRIGKVGEYCYIGETGTTSENKALNATIVTVAGEPRDIDGDDAQDGSNNGIKAMKKASTYATIGWDMTETWGIDEGRDYPYLLGFTTSEPIYEDSEYDECEAPTFSIENGKIVFDCSLENPTYFYKIGYLDSEYAEASSQVDIPSSLKLYVYATSGTQRTPVGCYDLPALNYDLNLDSKITAADVAILVNKVLEIESNDPDNEEQETQEIEGVNFIRNNAIVASGSTIIVNEPDVVELGDGAYIFYLDSRISIVNNTDEPQWINFEAIGIENYERVEVAVGNCYPWNNETISCSFKLNPNETKFTVIHFVYDAWNSSSLPFDCKSSIQLKLSDQNNSELLSSIQVVFDSTFTEP